MQGGTKFPYNTPLTPPYGRPVYDHNNESWIPGARFDKQSNRYGEHKVQNRFDFLDWSLGLSSVSLTLPQFINK